VTFTFTLQLFSFYEQIHLKTNLFLGEQSHENDCSTVRNQCEVESDGKAE
jgi:hypothetical protein